MQTLTRTWLTAMAILTVAMCGTMAAGADTVTREFRVAPGGTLDLETDTGRIEVATDGGSTLRVEVQREGRDGEDLKLDFDQQGDNVVVRAHWPDEDDDDDWHQHKARVKFLVRVPRQYNLRLDTSGGSIDVDDLDGTLDARTSGGSLEFGNIRGRVKGHTSGGSIKLAGAGDDVLLKTSGGSIRVGEVNGSLRAHTSGGSVRVAGALREVHATTSGGSVEATLLTQPSEDCVFSTSGGSVTLYMAGNLAVDIDARSSGGGVRSDFAVDGRTKAKRRLRGSLNGGGPTIRLESSGGGVRIRKAN